MCNVLRELTAFFVVLCSWANRHRHSNDTSNTDYFRQCDRNKKIHLNCSLHNIKFNSMFGALSHFVALFKSLEIMTVIFVAVNGNNMKRNLLWLTKMSFRAKNAASCQQLAEIPCVPIHAL